MFIFVNGQILVTILYPSGHTVQDAGPLKNVYLKFSSTFNATISWVVF